MFDPLEWASIALEAAALEDAWQQINARLVAVGLERSSLVMNHPVRRMRFPSRRSQVGVVISRDFEAFMRSRPDLSVRDATARRMSKGDSLFPAIVGHPQGSVVGEYDRATWEAMLDHGFKGGFSLSIHDRARGTFAALLTCSVTSTRDVSDAYDQLGRPIRHAILYFSEALNLRDRKKAGALPALSAREEECLTWVSVGRTTQEIADILGLADRTVDEYIANATRKLGASNRTHACARATLLSLISP